MNNKFSWQSFISIGLLFSFIVMVFSGIILYVAPEGSLSRWIGWDVLNLTKKQWEHQHTIFSYVFILFSVFHIFKINWSLLLTYLSPEKISFLYLKEILIALIIIIFVFTGTLTNLQPFRYVISLGNDISDSFAKDVIMPNIADAEKLSLDNFALKVFDIPYEDLEKILIEMKFVNMSNDIKVIDFCNYNNIDPQDLFIIIKGQLIKIDNKNFGSADLTSINSFTDSQSSLL